MLKSISAAVALLPVLGFAAHAADEDPPALDTIQGDGSPQVLFFATTGDEEVNEEFRLDPSSDGSFFDEFGMPLGTNEAEVKNATVEGNVNGFHTFSATFVDPGEESTFTASLLTSLIPLTGPVNWFAKGTIEVIGENGTDTFSPALPGESFFEHSIEGNVVSSLGSALTDVPTDPFEFISSGSLTCGDAGCSPLESLFAFEGAGGGGTYRMTASLTVTPVPIPLPAGLTLLLAGLGGLAVFRRRQRDGSRLAGARSA